MPKFLIDASYTSEGVKGVQSGGGTARVEAVSRAVEGLGGRVESFYFAFGDTDAYVVVDVPDNVTATAVALTVGASGAIKLKTTVLMTPEEVDRAFDPFWRASSVATNSLRGTGLGLALVKEYVRVMGGDVQVRSEPGRGSTFAFTLPLPESLTV